MSTVSVCVILGFSRELLSLFLLTRLTMITGLEGRLTNNTNSQTNLRPLLGAFIVVFQVFSQTPLLSLRLASCSFGDFATRRLYHPDFMNYIRR